MNSIKVALLLFLVLSRVVLSSVTFLKNNWEGIMAAELEAAIGLSVLYEGRDLYFLDRDAHRLGEMMKLVAKSTDNSDLKRKVHFLKISRNTIKNPLFVDYLQQEGISSNQINQGKKITIIDTGFSGTIPRAIKSTLDESAYAEVNYHLLFNAYAYSPSLRAFAASVNARKYANKSYAEDLIRNYAEIPKEVGAIKGYIKKDNKIEVVHDPKGDLDDGEINPKTAAFLAKETEKFVQKPETQKKIQERIQYWKKIKLKAETDLDGFVEESKKVLSEKGNDLEKAVYLDIIDYLNLNKKVDILSHKGYLSKAPSLLGCFRLLDRLTLPWRVRIHQLLY